jgi:hypothetical protein
METWWEAALAGVVFVALIVALFLLLAIASPEALP